MPGSATRVAVGRVSLMVVPGGEFALALLVEPDVIEAPVVVNGVLVLDMTLDVRVPARRSVAMKDDRPGDVLDEDALDPPDEGPALFRVGLLRLRLEQRVDLPVAVLGEIRLRLAGKAHLQDAVRVVDAGAGEIERNRVILLEKPAVPERGL